MRKVLLLSLLLSFFAVTARSEGFLITANRISQESEKASEKSESIDREEINAKGHAVLDEVLGSLNGFYVPSYGKWGASSPRIGGSQSKNILVMIDGIPLTDPAGIDRSFNMPNLSLDGIGSVEIITGPNSALYGSNAVSGVVNLISDPAAGNVMEITAAAGNHGFYGTAVSAQKSSGATSVGLNGSFVSADGENVSPAGGEKDGMSGYSFGGTVKHVFGESLTLKAGGRGGYNSLDYDNWGEACSVDDDLVQRSYFSMLYLSAETSALSNMTSRLKLSYVKNSRKYEDGGELTDEYKGTSWNLTLENEAALADSLRLMGGIDLRDEQAEQDAQWAGLVKKTLVNTEAYAGFVFESDKNLSVNSAVRFVSPSEDSWEDMIVFKGGLSYRSGMGGVYSVFKANYGTSYNMPSLYQTYGLAKSMYTGLFDTVGNPDLDPETGRGFNLSAEFVFGEKKAGLSFYYSHQAFEDYIKMDYALNKYINAEEAEIAWYQCDLFVNIPVRDFTFKVYGSYVNTDAENTTGGTEKDLAMVPAYMFRTGVALSSGFISADIHEQTVGDRTAEYPAIGLQPYSLLNGSVSVSVAEHLTMTLRAENILDKAYEQTTETTDYGWGPVTEISAADGYVVYPGYNAPGRSYRLSVKYIFSI